jgi:hypothetical protein
MCDFNFHGTGRRTERCPKPAIRDCEKCFGEYCGNHLVQHDCIEIIDLVSNQGRDETMERTGRSADGTENILNVNAAQPAVVITDAIQMQTMEFLGLCKEYGVCGIVVLFGGEAEMQILSHGVNAENASKVFRQIAEAAEIGTIETVIDADLRPSAAN